MAEPRSFENLVDSSELGELREMEEYDAPSSDLRHPRGRAGDAHQDIDPDSAMSGVDRDDTVDD